MGSYRAVKLCYVTEDISKHNILLKRIFYFFFLTIQVSIYTYHSFNPLPHNPNFKGPKQRMILKIFWEMKKMLVNSIFFFSQNNFYPLKDNAHILNNNYIICKCFQFGSGLNFSCGKELRQSREYICYFTSNIELL